ncbi:hypothetical protein [Halalkalibacterium halodurans]|uniref:hypothetical protein n=1 Tax=Halalkalibacterium halodurans TaxID=86665 RepID=UPI002E24E5F6
MGVHTKQTVKYRCERYPSGNKYYYKQEIITHDTWENIESLQWSTPRPITRKTFLAKKQQGYKIEYVDIQKPPAELIPFTRDE